MPVKIRKNGNWYSLSGNKVRHSGAWITLSPVDRIYLNSAWRFLGNVSSGVVLIGEQRTVNPDWSYLDTTISSGGELIVASGGDVKNTIVNNRGSLTVSSGAVLSNTTISSGGYYNGTSVGQGVINNKSGWNFMSNFTVLSGMTVYDAGISGVNIGGSALNCSAFPNCKISGYASSFNARANTIIYSGAVVSHMGIQRMQDGLETNVTVLLGASVSYVSVNEEADLTIVSGATVRMIKEQGGSVDVSDGAYVSFQSNVFSNLTISNNAWTTLHSGTTAIKTTIQAVSGVVEVYGGGVASKIYIASKTGGGGMIKVSGGYVNSADLHLSSYLKIYSGGIAENVSVHNINDNAYPSAGLLIESGGTALNPIVGGSGLMVVSSGGTALNVSVTDLTANIIVSDGGYITYA